MDDTIGRRALSAVGEANAHLLFAWKTLVGRRLPMAGVHRDRDLALRHLRTAQAQIATAIEAIEDQGEVRGRADHLQNAC